MTALLAILAVLSLGLTPSEDSVQIIGGKGDVMVFLPWSNSWTKVKNDMKVPIDAILSVGRDSRVVIKFTNIEDAFVIKQAAVIRLKAENLRQVNADNKQLSSAFINEIAKSQVQLVNEARVDFHDLYNRVSTFFHNTGFALKNWREFLANPSLSDAFIKKRLEIKLLYPESDTILLSHRFPHPVLILWEPVKPAPFKNYHVYLWRADQNPTPFKRVVPVKSTYITLDIHTPGDYLVQVSSEDDLYVSPVHSLKAFIAGQNTLSNEEEKDEEDSPLTLTYPPTPFYVKAKDSQIFCWEFSDSSFKGTFMLSLIAGDLTKSFYTSEKCLSLKLAPADYQWSLHAVTKKADKLTILASSRQQQIIVENPGKSNSQLINQAWQSQEKEVSIEIN